MGRAHHPLELPEEMSLFNVAEATPVPLTANSSKIATCSASCVRVLGALNEPCTLLRACGLDPKVWYRGIARLREIKQLRRSAEELMRIGIEDDNVAGVPTGVW